MWSLIELIHVIVRTIIFGLYTKSCIFLSVQMNSRPFFSNTFIYTLNHLIKWLPIWFTVDLVCMYSCLFLSLLFCKFICLCVCKCLFGVANKVSHQRFTLYACESYINLTFCRLDFNFHSTAVCYWATLSLSLGHSLQIYKPSHCTNWLNAYHFGNIHFWYGRLYCQQLYDHWKSQNVSVSLYHL